MPGAMIGETFGTIIAHQFEALRDGDQFYYEKAARSGQRWRWSRIPPYRTSWSATPTPT